MAKRNTYSAEYKSRIVIEVLEGEYSISEIASRENLNVNQLKNWKKEFIENASKAFSVSKEKRAVKKEMEYVQQHEEELIKTTGHLTVQVN